MYELAITNLIITIWDRVELLYFTGYDAATPKQPFMDFSNDEGALRYVYFKPNVHEWLVSQNIKYDFVYDDYRRTIVRFNNKDEAMLFKLTWIGL